jgi:hypothetical protein
MFFSAAKAERELGLPRTPVEEALGDAVRWFVEHGYAACPQGLAAAAGAPSAATRASR